MRVRLFELRLVALVLAGLWAATAFALLAVYRPGGPADLLVGVAAVVPLSVAAAAVAWPPAARGRLSFRTITALGVGTAIILAPSLVALVGQLLQQGLQVLLPSPEAAYPWGLAIVGTSLFAGLGVARRLRGAESGRPGRLGAALAIGVGLATVSGAVVAGAVITNELALRDRPAGGSRFGPTDRSLVPPLCDAPMEAGPTAIVTMTLEGRLDGRPLGLVTVRGTRAGDDFRWLAEVSTTRAIGFGGAAVVGGRGWVRDTVTRWEAAPADVADRQALDRTVVDTALRLDLRASAPEDLGLVYVEGARARRCRLAVDGNDFRAAFPQVRWLVGGADLRTWRGDLDVWVFADGQVGRAEGRLEGPGFTVEESAIRADLSVTLNATGRGDPVTLVAPAD